MGVLKSAKLKGIRAGILSLAVTISIAGSTLTAYADPQHYSDTGNHEVGEVAVEVVEYKEEKIEEIPYKTLYQYSSDLRGGESRVAVEGENGTQKIVGKVITIDGVITERSELERTVIKEPVNEIIQIGGLGALPETSYTFEDGISLIGTTRDKSVYISLSDESKGKKNGREIVEFAMQYIGSPYVWGGTSLTNGCDCSGFVYAVYNACGYEMPRNNMEYVYPISVDEMLPGDIIAYPSHYAIYIGGGLEISALNSYDGVCITQVGAIDGYYNAVRVVQE